MVSPEQEELRAARDALEQRDLTKPLSRDEIKRFTRAREGASRAENYAKYYDQWLEEVARQLDRSKESIHLLAIEETYHLLDSGEHIGELIRQGTIPRCRQYIPLSAAHSLAHLLQIMIHDVPEEPVILFRRGTTDFGAILATSTEVFRNAIAIIDETDANYIDAVTRDERSGFALRIRKDPAGDRSDDETPLMYEFEVWGDWVSILEPYR